MIRKNQAFFNVNANAQASQNIDCDGVSINNVKLTLAGTALTKAMLTGIKVIGDSKTYLDTNGTDLDKFNKYKGIHDQATQLTIPFEEVMAMTTAGLYSGAIQTGTPYGPNHPIPYTQKLSVVVDIGAATAPVLSSISEVFEPIPKEKRNLIGGLRQHSQVITGAGKWPMLMPFGPNAKFFLKRAHFVASGVGNITSVEAKRDGIVIHDDIPTAENEFVQKEYGRVPQTDVYTFDPVANGDLRRAINLGSTGSMVFNVTTDGACTVFVYADVYGLHSDY